MERFKGTTGTWSKDTWRHGDPEVKIWAPGTPIICKVPSRDVSYNEQDANVSLIIAAPELLDKLIKCEKLLRAGFENTPLHNSTVETIKKALGK